ncbi:sorting nexin-20 isoform X2 [Seriola aureovittata]|uniref:sorting nexin-20 isoform X2 n=1 Tax=Seriola aureovittata TaxID=2871759 RepID=UPI0024BE1942|nr:sorting nexin-20 isoform X2 [Seriola aureovittata]
MAEPQQTTTHQTETERPLASDEAPSCSSLTTKELQQNLRAVKQRQRLVRLMFEIPSTRIVDRALSKYVEEFGEELEEVLLPRKLLTGNFSPDIISERRLALQDYLAKLYSVRCARHSPHFPTFFTEQEQRRAHSLLRAGQFQAALQQLQVVLEIQEKLLPWQSPTLIVPTVCALAVCYRDLEQPEQAFAAAQRALPPVRRYGLKRYRASLLDLLVDLGYELGRPVAQIQDELTALRDAERGEVTSRSLKELVVQEFV